MNEHQWRIMQFEAYRTHLRAVAYRMLGTLSHRSSFARHYYAPVTTLTERDEGM